MTMREARIILPVLDNEGRSLAPVHEMLTVDLIEAFGGVTCVDCMGAWQDHNGNVHREAGVAYDVAMEPCTANDLRLVEIAIGAGRSARQLAMYVRLADGRVEIIDMAKVDA